MRYWSLSHLWTSQSWIGLPAHFQCWRPAWDSQTIFAHTAGLSWESGNQGLHRSMMGRRKKRTWERYLSNYKPSADSPLAPACGSYYQQRLKSQPPHVGTHCKLELDFPRHSLCPRNTQVQPPMKCLLVPSARAAELNWVDYPRLSPISPSPLPSPHRIPCFLWQRRMADNPVSSLIF